MKNNAFGERLKDILISLATNAVLVVIAICLIFLLILFNKVLKRWYNRSGIRKQSIDGKRALEYAENHGAINKAQRFLLSQTGNVFSFKDVLLFFLALIAGGGLGLVLSNCIEIPYVVEIIMRVLLCFICLLFLIYTLYGLVKYRRIILFLLGLALFAINIALLGVYLF
ncbi:MAG: hypothetical protein IJI34_00465 [Clostridia bacterium]|nr:hypothetical protein [Clostridia bacterium]